MIIQRILFRRGLWKLSDLCSRSWFLVSVEFSFSQYFWTFMILYAVVFFVYYLVLCDFSSHKCQLLLFSKHSSVWTVILSSFIIDENLSRVLNGSTQNPNESYHSLLWSMAPKSRSSSGAMIDFCVALSVIVYNNGFQSLLPLFQSLLGMK